MTLLYLLVNDDEVLADASETSSTVTDDQPWEEMKEIPPPSMAVVGFVDNIHQLFLKI